MKRLAFATCMLAASWSVADPTASSPAQSAVRERSKREQNSSRGNTRQTAAVATDHELATVQAGRILRAGGNATDAAITAALTLGVINPTSSGIGGGGFAVVYDAKTKQVRAYDFREMAPATLDPSDFIEQGVPNFAKAQAGGLAVGVPGEVAGLAMLSRNHGKLKWQDVVAPAHQLAQNGFKISSFFANAGNGVAQSLANEPSRAELVALLTPPGGLKEGQVLRRRALAKTLRTIAARGEQGFYDGDVAEDIVRTVTQDGGVMSRDDLTNYKVIERTPLTGKWHGYKLATMPLPSSGGLVLLETLAILDALPLHFDKLGKNDPDRIHLLAEAMKHAFADRARWLGDSANSADLAKQMLDPKRIAQLAARIDLRKTLAVDQYGGGPSPAATKVDDKGTSHLCVIDGEGNAVALTTTVNGFFGSKVLTKKSGIVLNNQIDDFSIAVGKANMFGLVQSAENLVKGGKRPLSSMTPTLVFEDDHVVGCVGGSGGPLIISGTLQVLLNSFALGESAEQAVSSPRIHHQWQPNQLVMQSPEASIVAALTKRGHDVLEQGGEAIVQFIRVVGGRKLPASDPDKGGAKAAKVFAVGNRTRIRAEASSNSSTP